MRAVSTSTERATWSPATTTMCSAASCLTSSTPFPVHTGTRGEPGARSVRTARRHQCPRPIRRTRSHLQRRDRLVLEVGAEPLGSHLATHAAGLVATEWRAQLGTVLVHTIGPGSDLACHVDPVRDVRGPHRAGQTKIAVVGNPNRVLLIGEGDDGQHRPEDLLAG